MHARLMKPKKIALWAAVGGATVATSLVLLLRLQHWRPRVIVLQGAVIRSSVDPRRELPISGALITVSDDEAYATTISGARGYFKVKFRERVWPDETVHLDFRRAGYKQLEMTLKIGLHVNPHHLYIAAMRPVATPLALVPAHPVTVSDIRIRYTVDYRTAKNIGSIARMFEAVNQSGVPCKGSSPCSPNGFWKASRGSLTLDAGAGNIFRNVRASCIAGPCPFTRIDSRGFAHGGKIIVASALDWSDTATFLVEAEVFHETIASRVRKSYPVIYGRELHFTTPPTAEGVSIEAEIGGTQIVFPLGANLYMNWTVCNSRMSVNRYTIYQCALKPGYIF